MRSIGALWLILASAALTFGQQRPNFTGTWKQVDVRDGERTNRIEHNDPTIKVMMATRGVAFALGGEDQYRTDASEEVRTNTATGRQTWRTVYWQGSELIFQTIAKEGYRVSITRESWRLSEDGRTLTKARRTINMDGVHEETQTFQKQ
jgi:hypothetical protein